MSWQAWVGWMDELQAWVALLTLTFLEIVFSLDSVITAVGMVQHLPVMVLAVVIAVGIMMLFADPVSRFVDTHPTVKMLALSFLLLIGLTLLADGLGTHISKGYVYFAMGFSVFVEMLNLKVRGSGAAPVKLRAPYAARAVAAPIEEAR